MPDVKTVFLDHLHSPFGVVLVGNDLYVADTDAVVRFPYTTGQTQITAAGVTLCELPGGPIDHHWTKSLTASPDGTKLYAGVGSNSNITENGIQAEVGRASIWEIDRATGAHREYATGLRNPNGLQFEPQTHVLWAVINERDELGPDLVPDYLTSVKDGAFYGWPYSYYGQHLDPRVKPQRPDLVAKSHRAGLRLKFARRAAWAWSFTAARIFPRTIVAAPSLASTAAGIAASSMATRSFRAVCEWPPGGTAGRCGHRLPGRRRPSAGPTGRARGGRPGRVVDRR